MRLPWQITADGVRLSVRLQPGARSDALCGLVESPSGQMLAARVRAPPQDGKANEALRQLLALTLRLPKRAITITHGTSSRLKLVEIEGSGHEIDATLKILVEHGQ